jgi:hypothetical protein
MAWDHSTRLTPHASAHTLRNASDPLGSTRSHSKHTRNHPDTPRISPTSQHRLRIESAQRRPSKNDSESLKHTPPHHVHSPTQNHSQNHSGCVQNHSESNHPESPSVQNHSGACVPSTTQNAPVALSSQVRRVQPHSACVQNHHHSPEPCSLTKQPLRGAPNHPEFFRTKTDHLNMYTESHSG